MSDFKTRTVEVFTQALAYLDSRRRWAEKLQAEGMGAPWSDPMDRLCIVVGILCDDLRPETEHMSTVIINNANPHLNDLTRWLVATGRAPKLGTPVETINAWGACGCVGWTGPAQYLPTYLEDVAAGRWEPRRGVPWHTV